MKNVKLTKKEYHQGVYTVQFVDDVTNAKVEEFMEKPQYIINAINLADPIHSFVGDKGEVLVNIGEEFELKMTDFFYQKVAAYKKARTNTVNVPNAQTYSNGAASIPDAASRMATAKRDKRTVAEGQVRFGFAKEAFKMGLELNDDTKKRVEQFTDYVMTERYDLSVGSDPRETPPPHTDADVPQEKEEALPF